MRVDVRSAQWNPAAVLAAARDYVADQGEARRRAQRARARRVAVSRTGNAGAHIFQRTRARNVRNIFQRARSRVYRARARPSCARTRASRA